MILADYTQLTCCPWLPLQLHEAQLGDKPAGIQHAAKDLIAAVLSQELQACLGNLSAARLSHALAEDSSTAQLSPGLSSIAATLAAGQVTGLLTAQVSLLSANLLCKKAEQAEQCNEAL